MFIFSIAIPYLSVAYVRKYLKQLFNHVRNTYVAYETNYF